MKKRMLLLLLIVISNNTHAQKGKMNSDVVKGNPVSIGQSSGFTVSVQELNTDPILRMPEGQKDYHITSFKLSYVPKETSRDLLGPFNVQGDNINKGNTANILNRVKPGDRLFFEDIIAISDDIKKQPLKLSAAIIIQ